MKRITSKKGMIPHIRKLLGAGKSTAQIMRTVKPRWASCTPYEVAYARRTQRKVKRSA